LSLALLVLAACSQPTEPPTVLPTLVPPTVTPAPTATLAPPTPTPEPLAARVNGRTIRLADYEAEVQRCQIGYTSAGKDSAPCPALALQSLIEHALVEQAAVNAGLTVSEAEVAAELARVQQGLGDAQAYSVWLAANYYTEAAFREAVRRDLLHARITAQVTASVGETAEQIHALAILVTDPATAQTVLEQAQSGADFATLALTYSLDLSSRVAGGDLGWFPRGLLTVPEVEAAAFALQPGETSAVIESALGFHIVRVVERDPVRALSPAAQQALRARAYQAWLDGLLAQASIEQFVIP
jgi:parvulin-like peptidyl-prolyl isomerase